MSQISMLTGCTSHQPQSLDKCAVGEVFDRAPVYDIIFSCISPRELVRLGHTCHATYAASKDYSRRAFSINRHLSRFLVKPLDFRSVQARTGTLIAGSNALQFLDRTFYAEADMDLYVHPGHAREVLDYCVESEGYKFKPHSRQPQDYRTIVSDTWDNTRIRQDYPIKGVKSVFSLEKHVADGFLKIQVIECAASPFDTIINFHSIATFEERSTLQVWRERPLHDLTVPTKYCQRGFQWFFALPGDISSKSFYPHKTRTVGDQYTWRLALDMQGVDLRPRMSPSSTLFQFDPVIYNGWSLLERDEEMATIYQPIQSAIFRYNYTTANALLHLDLYRFMLEQCFLRRTSLQEGTDLLEQANQTWFDAELARFWQAYKHN